MTLFMCLIELVFLSQHKSSDQFAYNDQAPLNLIEEAVEKVGSIRKSRWRFSGYQGGTVTALMIRPSSEDPGPAIIFIQPGFGNAALFQWEMEQLATTGYVCLSIDAPFARPEPFKRKAFDLTDGDNERELFIQTVVDTRRALDLLESTNYVEPHRVALTGFSFGATISGILSAVEPRFKTVTLMGTCARYTDGWRESGNKWVKQQREKVDPSTFEAYLATMEPLDMIHFIGQAKMSILFQFGDDDVNVNRKQALELYELGPPEKEIKWWQGGHQLNETARLQRLEWFNLHL